MARWHDCQRVNDIYIYAQRVIIEYDWSIYPRRANIVGIKDFI